MSWIVTLSRFVGLPISFGLLLFADLSTIADDSVSESKFRPGGGSFDGTWEGTLLTTSDPTETTPWDFRLEFAGQGTIYSRTEGDDYRKLGPCVPLRIDEDRLHCTVLRSGGVGLWNEIFSLDLVRLDDDRAFLYVKRVVDNPGARLNDEKRHFSFDMEGGVMRAGLDSSASE
jgi:hypothetical protein